MGLLQDSFQSAAASMDAVNSARTIGTLTQAYAAAIGPRVKDLCGPSIAEQFDDLTGMRQAREALRHMDQIRSWLSGDFACNKGQAVLKEMARQSELSQIVDRCLSLDYLGDLDAVGRIAASVNAPWFDASDMLRQQAEAWLPAGECSTGASIRSALGANAASQVVGILEREARAWDAWAEHWRDPLQDLVSRTTAASARSMSSDFLNDASRDDLQASFGPAVDARRMISDAIGQLGALGYAAYEEQARKAFDDILRLSAYRWADGRFDREQFHRQERSRATFESNPVVYDEPLAEKRALARLFAFVWHRLRTNVPKLAAVFVVTTLANIASDEYHIWRTRPAATPVPTAHTVTPTPSAPVQLNVENAIVVDAKFLAIRQEPNAKARVLTFAGYGHVLRVLKAGAKNWVLVEYVDPVHPGVSLSGWTNASKTKRVGAETLRLLWCGMIEKSASIDQCRPN
jgi:hypothetical protein